MGELTAVGMLFPLVGVLAVLVLIGVLCIGLVLLLVDWVRASLRELSNHFEWHIGIG